jgi:hypothetical protein
MKPQAFTSQGTADQGLQELHFLQVMGFGGIL